MRALDATQRRLAILGLTPPGNDPPTPTTGPERLPASPHIEQSEPEFPTSLHRIAHRSATNPRFPRVFCQCCVPSGSTSQVVFAQHVTRPMKVGGDEEEIIARHLNWLVLFGPCDFV